MPNNLVFNYSAQELKAQIYGITSGATLTGILVDNNGVLQIGGGVTATIANTVTVTANSFDIRSLSAATDTVSVSGGITATIANTVTVSIGGHAFTSSNLTISTGSGALTNTAFQFDTSQYKDYSFYIVNTGTAAVSVRLQISPTTTETFFTNDNTPEISLAPNTKAVLVPGFFLNYTRVQVTGSETVTALAYFNAQS
jgi:hypothetical protein